MRHSLAGFSALLLAFPPLANSLDIASCPCGDLLCCPQAEVVMTATKPAGAVMTVLPDGLGDSFESREISLRIRLTCDCNGAPLVGVLASEVTLEAPTVCLCRPWEASEPTDTDGWTVFRGSPRAGGCANALFLFVGGTQVTSIALRVVGPDAYPASPCFVDSSDLPALTVTLGQPSRFTECSDFNHDGFVDAGDVASFASALSASCSP